MIQIFCLEAGFYSSIFEFISNFEIWSKLFPFFLVHFFRSTMPSTITLNTYTDPIEEIIRKLKDGNKQSINCGMIGEDRDIPLEFVFAYIADKFKDLVDFTLEEQQVKQILEESSKQRTWLISKDDSPHLILLGVQVQCASFSVRMCSVTLLKNTGKDDEMADK